MSASIYAANLIPGDQVANAFADLQVAVRTNPGFAIVCVRTNAGLGDVFNAAFDLTATQPEAHNAEV